MVQTIQNTPSTVSPRRKIEQVERLFCRSPGGAELLDELRKHAQEVNFLVQRNRRVGAVWQRNAGPAFARAIVDSGFDERVRIPESIGDATLEGLLLAMADALQRHCSIELRRTIADNAHHLVRCARECTTLRELIDASAALRFEQTGEKVLDRENADA